MTILLLGGTAEARELASLVAADGTRVVSSLAGRVERSRLEASFARLLLAA